MGGLRSGLVTVVVAGALGVFTVIGCSADGSTGGIEDTTPVEPEPISTLPPSSSSGGPDDAGKPDAKKDAAKDSAPPDAGPPPPVPGTACTTVDEVRTKTCGACGKASTLCLDIAGVKTMAFLNAEGGLPKDE